VWLREEGIAQPMAVIIRGAAAIAEAEQTVRQLKASLDEANADVEKAKVQPRLQEEKLQPTGPAI
jgi:multidrug resistance efflux pump